MMAFLFPSPDALDLAPTMYPTTRFIMSVPPKPPEILCYYRRVIDDKNPQPGWISQRVVGRRATACQRRDEIDIDQVIYLQYPFLRFSKCAHNAWNTRHWYTRIESEWHHGR